MAVGYTKLDAGLKRLSAAGTSIYMISGTSHTHTGGKASFFTTTSGGTTLLSWVTQLVKGRNPGSVTPH
jgi:hypothetical protein